MNCSFCGTAFQVGVAYCPSCGALTPYAALSQGVPQYNPTSGMPQTAAQQPQTMAPHGLPIPDMGGYQQYSQNQAAYSQSGFMPNNPQGGQQPMQPMGGYQQYPPNPQNQAAYSQSGFIPNNPQIGQQAVQGSATQYMFPPVQQSNKLQTGQATGGYNPLSQSSSKLSDYKQKPTAAPQQAGPAGSYNATPMTNTKPSLKLSQYGQNPTQPGKLSDFKPATTQPSKLSDFKPVSASGPTSLASFKAFSSLPTATPGSFSSLPTTTPNSFSSIPTATPGSFSSIPSLPMATPGPFNAGATNASAPNTGHSIFTPPAMPNPFGAQSTQPTQPTHTNTPNMANPSFFVPPNAVGGYNPSSQVMPPNAVGGYNPSLQAGAPTAPTQNKAGGLLFGTIAVILVIICIGAASVFLYPTASNANDRMARATQIAMTPVPTVAPMQGPSGNTSVPAISALFSTPQMTTGVDDNNKPKQLTSTFSSGQTIYVSFTVNSKNQKGSVVARWYKGKELFKEVSFPHDPNNMNGYFSIVYDAPTTDGSVELYWSTTSNLDDAKLACVAHFTVTAGN